ncbi:hypothetical protein D3C85_1119130 [compost metagenome]
MLKNLIENYEDFGDALITEIHYKSNFNYQNVVKSGKHEIDILISCFNRNRDYERDLIKITCIDIKSLKIQKSESMIFGALMKEEEGIITLDFFPILDTVTDEGDFILGENIESDCIIKCREVIYKVLE